MTRDTLINSGEEYCFIKYRYLQVGLYPCTLLHVYFPYQIDPTMENMHADVRV